jgi:hypothetical protein
MIKIENIQGGYMATNDDANERKDLDFLAELLFQTFHSEASSSDPFEIYTHEHIKRSFFESYPLFHKRFLSGFTILAPELAKVTKKKSKKQK